MSPVTSPGILLRSHPYSETSRILRFLTPGHGVVAVVAKGIRKEGGRRGGAPETFQEGTLTFAYRANRDLHTLTDFQPSGRRLRLGRDLGRFLGASLLGELILTHTLEEGDEDLYAWVRHALDRLSEVPDETVPAAVLAGAWRLLDHFGFGPELDRCVACGAEAGAGGEDEEAHSRYDVVGGGLRCGSCGTEGPRVGPGAREDLRALVRGELPGKLPGAAAHLRILEGHALHHLGGRRPLRSVAMLLPLLEED